MRVIFLHDVPRVGKRYDVKEVNDGYAMNFLIPRMLGELATPKAIAELEKRKKSIEIEKEIQEELLLKNLEEIKGMMLNIKTKTDEKGHLFSGINKNEIVEEMKKQNHVDISEDSIVLEKPIKEVGEYEIPVMVKTATRGGTSKKSSFKLIIEKN